MTRRVHTLEDLKKLGREWRETFVGLEFVGELDVSEQEVQNVCDVAGKHLGHSWNEDFRAALTVAVVNIAYFASSEISDSFRWQVLSRLGYDHENTPLWEESVGAPILQVLTKNFGEEDVPGPNRYVRPIMRQAGVPARLVNRFAMFFQSLSRTLSWPISELEYRQFSKTYDTHSLMLANFLDSKAGWRYCCDVARVIKNSVDGNFSGNERLALPGFRGEVLSNLWKQLNLQHVHSIAAQSLPAPSLVLDLTHLRLALRFSEKGLNGNYQWRNGRRVVSALYQLKEDDWENFPGGSYQKQPSQLRIPWHVVPWNPSDNPWAVFLSTNGAFLESFGRIRPGRYLLVLPDAAYAKLSDFSGYREYEDCGALLVPGQDDRLLRVADCELPAGLNIPEIDLFVSGDSSIETPSLRFQGGIGILPNAHNVFLGRLPGIEIIKWSPSFPETYMIKVDSGVKVKAVPEVCYRDQNVFSLPADAPAQGTIVIEPKGRTPRGFNGVELPYAVLPAEVRLNWPRGLCDAKEDLTIILEPAERFEVSWEPELTRIQGAWHVPTHVNYVSGQVSYERSITFPISGPIQRLRITGPAIEDRVLWLTKLKEKSALRLSLSAEESGKHINIGVLDGHGFIRLARGLGPVTRGCDLYVTTASICDAFGGGRSPAGRLAVELPGGRIVGSEICFLDEREIIRRLFEDTDNDFDTWRDYVPADLQNVLRYLRRLLVEPTSPPPKLTLSVPEPLLSFVNFYLGCGTLLDWEDQPDSSDVPDNASRRFLEWLIRAHVYFNGTRAYRPADVTGFLKELPSSSEIAAFLPRGHWKRWRTHIAHFVRTLRGTRGIKSLQRTVREWSHSCRNEHWIKAKNGEIGKAPGGTMLTDGALDYFHAIEWKLRGNISTSSKFFQSANSKFEATKAQTGEGVVWEIATALSLMIFYHEQHIQLCDKAAHASVVLGDHWQHFKQFTSVLCDIDVEDGGAVDALGLSDISPHVKDAELEEIIFNEQ